MEQPIWICLGAVAILCGIAYLVFRSVDGGEHKNIKNRSAYRKTGVHGGGNMFKKKEDPFADSVTQINEIRDGLGLPRMPIETIHDAFAQMSPRLLRQLELHTGPIFKENVAGWVSLMLELIGKHNQDLGHLSIEENRWAIEHIRLRDAGKFAEKNLAEALEDVDAVVGVLADHGEENADDVRRALRRRVFYQIVMCDYLPKLPGAQKNPELIESAMHEILQYLPEEARVEVLEGQVTEYEFDSNGNTRTRKELRR